ncbi:MAG: RICIN domain-containing protein [Actinobacteria bacterium]|nr:RICIN domain-containing protein [Actinomycetota bacterium]
MRKTLVAALVALAVVGGSAVVANPAHALPPQGRLMRWVNNVTGQCLDSNHAGQVYTLPCQPFNQYQKWYVGRNNHTLVNFATGRCLDSNYAGRVYTLPCNGGNYQNWEHVWPSHLQDLQTQRCLGVNGRSVYAQPCYFDSRDYPSPYQVWRLSYQW